MADTKISQLTQSTTMATGDLLPLVVNPLTTPVTKSISRANFMGGTNIGQVVGTTETQTLTNKTITNPVIATISNTGTLTLPTSTDTLLGRATTDTLTNKTYDTAGTGNVFKINGTAISAVSGTGSVALTTSPVFTTPTIGVATATSVNKVTITAPASAATLTIANNKTLTVNATLSLSGTDSTTITFQATDTYVGRATTDTLTNKRITKRITTLTSSATPTVNTDNCEIVTITALATAITSMTSNLSGTPTAAQTLIYRILDNGTARAITWGASFVSRGMTLPTTTVLSKYLYVGFLWNEVANTWDCVVSVQES